MMHSGGSIVDGTAAFTTDAQYLLAPSGTTIKLYSRESGAILRVLEGHADLVTAVAHSSANVLQALSAGLDGRVIVWDLDDAIPLRCFCVGLPIVALAVHHSLPDAAFLLIGSGDRPAWTPEYAMHCAATDRVVHVSLSVDQKLAKRGERILAARAEGSEATGERGKAGGKHKRQSKATAPEGVGLGGLDLPWPMEARLLFKVKGASTLTVGSCGGHSGGPFVATVSGPWLTVHAVAARTTLLLQRKGESRSSLVAAALSPTELLAATGDDSGRMHLWHLNELAEATVTRHAGGGGGSGGGGDGAEEKTLTISSGAAPARLLHWHAQRLGAIVFSVDGESIFSAGKEGVLVYWATSSSDRAFLPRLGAPIVGIAASSDGAALALRGADNAIRLIDIPSRTVTSTIFGLRRAASMLADARLSCVVVYGGAASATLQWWAPQRDAQLLSLQAAPTNLSGSLPAIGTQRDRRRRSYRDTAAAGGTAALCVTHASLSADGLQLCTLEARAHAELRQHTCLKFWTLRDGSWSLVTRVPQPHAADVSAVAFHPTLLLALSAAHDAKFKLWEGVAPPAPPPPDAAASDLARIGGDAIAAPTVAEATPPVGASASQASPGTPLSAGSAIAGWGCRAVGYYRQSAAAAAAFSADGSLLAVAYAPNVITLWEPMSTLLLSTLAQPLADASDSLCHVSFPADGGTLFAHSSRAFFCWSLLSGQLIWAYRAAEVIAAAADPCSDAALVAVAVSPPAESDPSEGQSSFALLEFASGATNPAEGGAAAAEAQADEAGWCAGATPRRAWRLPRGRPRAVGFLPSAEGPGEPLCLTADGELFALTDAAHEDGRTPSSSHASQRATVVSSAVTSSRSAAAVVAAARPVSLRRSAPTKLAAIFGAPTANVEDFEENSAVLPSMSFAAASSGETPASPAVDADRRPGWEARAIDAWVEKNLKAVPSHLLPPVSSIYPQLVHAVLLPAPHLVGPSALSEVEQEELAKAKAKGPAEVAALTKAVENWAPALRRGFLTAKQRAAGSSRGDGEVADAVAMPVDDAEGALAQPRQQRGGSDALGGELLQDAEEAQDASLAAAIASGRVLKPKSKRTEAIGDRAGAVVPSSAHLTSGSADPGGSKWPPKGMMLLDMCGVPNPGYLVLDIESQHVDETWDGKGMPPGLSKEDAEFWRQNALSEAEVEHFAEWMAQEDIGVTEGESIPLPDTLPWTAEDEDPDELWQRLLDSGLLQEHQLPPARADGGESQGGMSLAEEVLQAAAALQEAGLKADVLRGHDIEEGPMPESMSQPPTPGWQSEPDKSELKALAKEYRKRRNAGESAESLAVLAAGLRVCSSQAVRRVTYES